MNGVRIVETLGDHPRLFASVLTGFADGIDAGAFPPDRQVPVGTESCAFYALDDIEALAFATFYQPHADRRFYWLDLLWVEPEFRERGIAGALIQAIADHAGRHAIQRIDFGTTVTNDAMRRLASKLGCDEFSVGYRLELGHG